MKKLLSIILTFVAFSSLYAQDTIRLRSGETIPAQVQEIGISEIRYKQWSNLQGPTYVQPKSNVLSISYKNGTRDNFITIPSQDQTNPTSSSSSSSTDQAFSDALNPNHYPLIYDKNSESYLFLYNRALSPYEAEQILGEEKYGTFMSGVRQRRSTQWMVDVGALLTIGSVVLLGTQYAANENPNYGLITLGLIMITTSIPMFIVGLAVAGSGNRRANNVISDYNTQMNRLKSSSPATLSFNLSPVSAGLTLSF